MSPAGIAARLLGVVVVAVIAVIAVGGGEGYTVHVPMSNAGGLRDGARVAQGGVDIGQVSIGIGADDQVDAKLHIEEEYAPIPKDATIAVIASNLLGQKHVEVVGGDPDATAPDGSRLSRRQVTQGTDLDQVLNVLDADTRTRLAIVLNQAGASVAGRKSDIAHILDALPKSFSLATSTVQQLIRDNHTLGQVVADTDSFVAEAAGRRADVRALVRRFAGATDNLASRRAQLRATLAASPRAASRLRTALDELRRTASPLGAAARQIAASAPLADDLLDRVEPLRVAANPTLKTATRIAPQLTRLGQRATPTIKRARPLASALNTFAQALAPLTRTLNKTADNLLATADNWTKAIQFRDGMSHVFRGEASASPDLILSAIKRLAPTPTRKRRSATPKKGAVSPLSSVLDSLTPSKTKPKPARKALPLPDPVEKAVGDVLGAVGDLLDPKGAAGGRRHAPTGERTRDLGAFLDYLLK